MELEGKTAIVDRLRAGHRRRDRPRPRPEGANIVVNDLNAENCRDAIAKIEAMGGRPSASGPT